MPDVLKLQCDCPVCGSSGKLGGNLEIYGVDFSQTPLQLDRLGLFSKWLKNGRWPAGRLLAVTDIIKKEQDWFQCASCDYCFPIPADKVNAITLLALSHLSADWQHAFDIFFETTRPAGATL
jgi:hypothetical protein